MSILLFTPLFWTKILHYAISRTTGFFLFCDNNCFSLCGISVFKKCIVVPQSSILMLSIFNMCAGMIMSVVIFLSPILFERKQISKIVYRVFRFLYVYSILCVCCVYFFISICWLKHKTKSNLIEISAHSMVLQ